jgi:hypothetical protein
MSERYGQHRRHEWVEERFGRYARRVHQLLYSCDGCGNALHQTHNYVLYGNVCWTCWRLNQRYGDVMASHERQKGRSVCRMSSLRLRVIS